MTPERRAFLVRGAVLLVVLVLAAYLRSAGGRGAGDGGRTAAPDRPLGSPVGFQGGVEAAFRGHADHVELETGGRVVRVLPDDDDGARHERFVLRSGGTTVLVAHNIDIAPRAPVRRGDSVVVRGEYVWNERGGVLHWTHRDPSGRHQAGWIRVEGKLFQ